MPNRIGLIANLNLCMGCFACEVACKQEHHLLEGEAWIKVMTIGPSVIEGELAMDFVPMTADHCDLCADRRAAGDRPFCAKICPTRALTLQCGEEILKTLRTSNRFHLCKMLDESV